MSKRNFTYIPSNGNHFFRDIFTYIPSNAGNHELTLPISIFQTELSGLEAITKFLKENKQMRFCEIAKLLKRDDRTIWDAYNSASKKTTNEFSDEESPISVPISIFENRTFSILESITSYMKDKLNYRYCHIAQALGKDARTIWTVYNRMQNKLKNAA